MELIGLRPKSRFSDVSDARVIRAALAAARGVETPIPVYSGRKKLGYAVGQRFSPYTYWLSITSIDTFVNDVTVDNKRYSARMDRTYVTPPGTNTWYDLWSCGVNPQPGVYAGAASTSVAYTDATAGAMCHGGNVSPDTKHVIGSSGFLSSASNGIFVLYDRVLGYENCPLINGTTSLTNSVSAPRYNAGAPGLMMTVTSQTVLGGAVNLTAVNYTNQSGTPSRAVPGTYALSAGQSATTTAPAQIILPNFLPLLPVQAPDEGMRSVQSYTTSAVTTGALAIILLRPIAYVGMLTSNVPVQYNLMLQIANMERVYDGACLSLLYACTTTTNAIHTQWNFDFAW